MQKDKQIEEMAKTLGGTWVVDLEGNPHGLSEVLMQCDIENISEQLCEMNYRKASDVAREIFEEIEKCRVIGGRAIFGGQIACYLKDDIDELKKKYTEGGE